MNTIEGLYGEVNNLENFTHPIYGHTKFLSEVQIIDYAKEISKAILESGRNKVVVSETGARPLAYICERLLEGKGIEWKYMKFPRDQNVELYPIISYYLTESEKQKHNRVLKELCENQKLQESTKAQEEIVPTAEKRTKTLSDILGDLENNSANPLQKDISQKLKETEIAKYLGVPFLYFDEYVDSGKTLQNANTYFKYFSEKMDFKIISYFIYTSKSRDFQKVQFSLFDQDSFKESFIAGAYPFENRLDLIGYYYYMNGAQFKKINLDEIYNGFKEKSRKIKSSCASKLIEDIQQSIFKQNILQSYKNNFEINSVREFVSEQHIIRQYILCLEESLYGKGPYYEYLWQLADMYGPIWSPMPKENHLDFFSGTEKSELIIKNTKGYEKLIEEYKQSRAEILFQTAKICLGRQKKWRNTIDKLITKN